MASFSNRQRSVDSTDLRYLKVKRIIRPSSIETKQYSNAYETDVLTQRAMKDGHQLVKNIKLSYK